MSYHGNIKLGDTIDLKFTTVNTSAVPTTLAGSPVVSAYVGNGTTEITAGITLTVDFDGRTGLHNVRVVATTGNGFATATNVILVITTGTVNAVSVVGVVIGSFSIEARAELQDIIVADSVPADGTRPTPGQALYMLLQYLTDSIVVGTTRTTRKVDGSTTLMTHTLNDASSPTGVTRTT